MDAVVVKSTLLGDTSKVMAPFPAGSTRALAPLAKVCAALSRFLTAIITDQWEKIHTRQRKPLAARKHSLQRVRPSVMQTLPLLTTTSPPTSTHLMDRSCQLLARM